MSNKLYTLSMELDREFVDDDNNEEDSTPTYTGVIANKKLTSYYTHLSSKVLKSFAKKAREGVMVLANHNRGMIVGRSVSGTYSNDEEVRSKFYIQRGLEFSGGSQFGSAGYKSTDDYIKAIDKGTYRDLSVGFNNYTEVCDYCNEEIKGSWFFTGDKNGHYPGQTIYVDKDGTEYDEPGRGLKEVLITAEITNGDLFEYSLVDTGALPGAEVVKQAQLRKLDDNQKLYLLKRYGININEPGDIRDQVFRFSHPIELLPEEKSFSFPTIKEENKMQDNILKESAEETIGVLNDQINKLTEEVTRLQDENLAYEASKKDFKDQAENIKKKDSEISSLKETVTELEEMKDDYLTELERAKDVALSMWTRAKGNDDVTEFNEIMAQVTRISSVRRLTRDWKIQGDAQYPGGRRTGSVLDMQEDAPSYDPEDFYNL